jgi:subtilisin family serine protease
MSAITPFGVAGLGAYYGVNDMRNSNYQLAKLSGTSMACPQAAGVIACHLENNPSLTPAQAKAWVTGAGLRNQLTAGNGGMYDGTDLQGSQNVMLYLPPTATPGQIWPIDNWQPLPSSGQIWPRTNNISGSV